jgi:hypothetical protein
MKKVFCIVAISILLFAACNSVKKEAANAQDEALIEELDSLVTEMDSINNNTDSLVLEADEF